MQKVKSQHNSDGSSGTDGNRGADTHESCALALLIVVVGEFNLWQEGRKWWELGDIASKGVEEANGGVVVAVQE